MQLSISCRRAAPAMAVAALLAPVPGRAQQPEAYGAFLDSVEVRVVNVDVVVTDKAGHFVPGLTRDDFELLLDGKPVAMSNFAAYAPPALAASGTGEAAIGGGEADAAAEDTPQAAPSTAYAMLIDQSLIRPGERKEILDQLQRFLESGLRPGDRVLIATYNQGLRLLTDLTADTGVLDAALAGLGRSAPATSEVATRQASILRDITFVDPGDTRTAAIDADRIFEDIQSLESAAILEARAGMDALGYLSDALAGVDGRKALVYAGAGFSDSPVAHLYSIWSQRLGSLAPLSVPPPLGGAQKGEFERRQRALIERAGGNRVTLYFIGAGPGQGPNVEGADSALSSGGTGNLSPLAAMRYIAGATGGVSLKASPQLAVALGAVADDFSRYYSLAFSPAADLEYHRIDVRLRSRSDLKVRHRGGFRAEDPGARASETAVAALLFNATANPLEASASSGVARREGRGAELLLPVSVKVPLQHITLLPQGDHHQGKLSLDFAARDPGGQVIVMERRDLEFAVPNDQLAGALRQFVTFDVDLKLRSGAYRVGVVVHDELGRAASSLTFDAQVAAAP
jgi:VWFA-related protein